MDCRDWCKHRTGSTFPAGTLVVNLVGCLLLGGIAEYALTHLSDPAGVAHWNHGRIFWGVHHFFDF